MSSRAWLALALVAVSGCRSDPFPDLSGTPGLPDASWVNSWFGKFDPVVAAAGLRPLRDTRLPSGQREVRVWFGRSIAVPEYLFRVVEQEDTVTGELIEYWRVSPDFPPRPSNPSLHETMVETERDRCEGFARAKGYGTCRALFTRPPDWAAVLQEAEAAGLWTLQDPSTLGWPRRIVIDGTALTVELRTHDSYRAYHYDFPSPDPVPPEADQAGTIMRAFLTVARLVPPRRKLSPSTPPISP